MENELLFAFMVLGYGLIALAVAGLAAAIAEAILSRLGRNRRDRFEAYRIICGQAVPLDEAHRAQREGAVHKDAGGRSAVNGKNERRGRQ